MRTLAVLAFAATLMAAPAFAADHAVTIKGMKFDPPTLSIAAGDTITFTNEDGAPHTATAEDGAFDTGRLSKGQSATVTVDAAGEHPYKCQIHTSMKGAVTVQ